VAFGDRREKVCAFVNIDFDGGGQLGRAAQHAVRRLHRPCAQARRAGARARLASRRSTPTSPQDARLSGSQVSRFLVLHKELDADDGELTRTRKVRPRGRSRRSTACS
jgi:long-chain acyl-CoA synthetase